MGWVQKATPGTSVALPCSQRLTVQRAVKIPPTVSSPLSYHSTLPSTSLCLCVIAGIPALKHLLCLGTGGAERMILKKPISHGMGWVQKTPPGSSVALPCSQRLTVSRAVKISPTSSSPLSSHSTLPCTSLCLLSSHVSSSRQCPQPCCSWQRSCSCTQLCLGSAARLP